MAEYALTLVLLLGLAAFVGWIDTPETRDFEGAATVHDGDTLTLARERIRLRGIDAPELGQTCERAGADYACGRAARAALLALVADKSVRCSGWERDVYGRLLGDCGVGALDLNRALVEAGWAVAYGGYSDAETAARAGRRGLWAGDFERPRAWRVRHGEMADAEHAARNWLRRLVGWR